MAGHLAVGGPRGGGQPLRRPCPGGPHPCGDDGRRLAPATLPQEIGASDRLHLDPQVHPVEQRTGQPCLIAADHRGRTLAARPVRVCRPQGHGLAARTMRNRAGSRTTPAARATTTCPDSSGWRSASSAFPRTPGPRPEKAPPYARGTPLRASAPRCRRRSGTAWSPSGAGRSTARGRPAVHPGGGCPPPNEPPSLRGIPAGSAAAGPPTAARPAWSSPRPVDP